MDTQLKEMLTQQAVLEEKIVNRIRELFPKGAKVAFLSHRGVVEDHAYGRDVWVLNSKTAKRRRLDGTQLTRLS